MEKVKTRRHNVYRYIIDRLGEGFSPSVREICKDLNIPSTSTVHGDLHHLIDKGLIEMSEGRNRTIRLPGPGSVHVPLLGTVTAGEPILAVENIEQYIPVAMLGRKSTDSDLFALRVKGDSMQNAAILSGDIVVVERSQYANNGEIVVALLEDDATVKRFYKEDGHFRLQPENDSYEPIIVDELEILGKVICVYRFYS